MILEEENAIVPNECMGISNARLCDLTALLKKHEETKTELEGLQTVFKKANREFCSRGHQNTHLL